MGMLIGFMGREKGIILKKGNLEKPSDIAALIYLEYNTTVDEIKEKIEQRFFKLGIQIDIKS